MQTSLRTGAKNTHRAPVRVFAAFPGDAKPQALSMRLFSLTVFVSRLTALVSLLLPFSSAFVTAQSVSASPIATKEIASTSLPDSPKPQFAIISSSRVVSGALSGHDGQTSGTREKPPGPSAKFISEGQSALPQKAGDKLLLSMRESITPGSMLGWAFAAEWSQLINTPPHYGVNGEAYAQRLGAAAALSSSKKIFGDGVLAIAFHQDPRYYQMGHSHRFLDRAVYAATRSVVGRTDSGKAIPNYALILGSGSASALTQAYYPDRNVHVRQFATTWATTLAGSSVGYLVSEFGDDALQWLRVKLHK